MLRTTLELISSAQSYAEKRVWTLKVTNNDDANSKCHYLGHGGDRGAQGEELDGCRSDRSPRRLESEQDRRTGDLLNPLGSC